MNIGVGHGWIAGVGAALVMALAGGCYDSKESAPADETDDAAAVDADAATCGATLPHGCPTAPSYAATIAPLYRRACTGCHGPGGVASDRDFTTHAGIARFETTEIIQLYACQMPLADAGADAALSLAERETMLQWLVCGYPDN